MVAIAANSLLGLTKTESVLKLFELKLISSKVLKKLRSLGRVHKSFDATSSTLNLFKYYNSYKWLVGILLYERFRTYSYGKAPSYNSKWSKLLY